MASGLVLKGNEPFRVQAFGIFEVHAQPGQNDGRGGLSPSLQTEKRRNHKFVNPTLGLVRS
jgi:hypothetical protein